DRAGVEMIATDHDRRRELPGANHLVEGEPRPVTLAEPEPADARRQALERDSLARHVQPAMHVRMAREQLLDLGVRLVDVLRIAGQGDPAERSFAQAEQRPDVRWHETRKGKCVLHALIEVDLADVVAIVDYGNAHLLEFEHRSYMHRAGARSFQFQLLVLRRIDLCGAPALHAPAERQIAVDEIVRGRLIRHQVGLHAALSGALRELRKNLRGVAEQTDRYGFAACEVMWNENERLR